MIDFAARLRETFPIASDTFSIELAPEQVDASTGEVVGVVREDTEGYLRGALRTFIGEIEGEARSIRDIKEQDVLLLYPEQREDPRLEAYLAGWAAALRFLCDRHAEIVAATPAAASPGPHLTHRMRLAPDPPVDTEGLRLRERIDTSMPCDFVYPDVLSLRRPVTADDFTEALLSSKKRLGRFVLP